LKNFFSIIIGFEKKISDRFFIAILIENCRNLQKQTIADIASTHHVDVKTQTECTTTW